MYNKTTWIDNVTVADETNMNHIEEGVYQNSLGKQYSTSEYFTGKYWKDGKPIYGKVLENITLQIGVGVLINTEIDDVDKFTFILPRFETSTQQFVGNQYYGSSNLLQVNSKLNGKQLYYDNAGFSGTMDIILEYTKTTE